MKDGFLWLGKMFLILYVMHLITTGAGLNTMTQGNNTASALGTQHYKQTIILSN